MHAYSIDLRERIVRAVEADQARATVARTFQVSLSTVKRYAAQHRTSGSLAPKRPARQQPRITPAHYLALLAQLAAQPDATLEEHCQTWAQTQGVRVSVPTMWRAITRVGWTPKKSP